MHSAGKNMPRRCRKSLPNIKVGVGEKPEGWDLADHVLGHFSKEERACVEEAIENACTAAAYMAGGEISRAMNEFNHVK